MGKNLPCIPMGCSACCRDTTMPITKTESAVISRRTGMETESFAWDNNGILTLLNSADTEACVFLITESKDVNAPGICSIYEFRPKGCTTYPVVLDSNDNAILDDGCPYKDKFPEPTEDDAMTLLNLEEKLLDE